MQHIIQMSSAQLTLVNTAGYWKLCLVTVIFNSETQLLFSYVNLLKIRCWMLPSRYKCVFSVLRFLTHVWKFLSETGVGLEPALWMSRRWRVPTFSANPPPPTPTSHPPFLFQQGDGEPQCYHSLILFESGRVWAGKGAKRASWVVRGGNAVISKGRVVKNNWAI